MRGPKRRATYGMSYGAMSGVQSIPRIMRGAPVTRGAMFDLPLNSERRRTAILKQQGRLVVVDDKLNDGTGTIVRQVPMQGLESQGFAHTLSGTCFGDIDFDDGSVTECMRRGDVMHPDGTCSPDTRSPINPYSVAPVTTGTGVKITTQAATSSKMPSKQLLVLGAIAVGAIIYFGRK